MNETNEHIEKSNVVMSDKVKRTAKTIEKILKEKYNVMLSHTNCIMISLSLESYQDEEDLLIIDSIEKAKLMAKILKQNLLIQFNVDIKHTACLEIVSAILGYKNWNTAHALLKKNACMSEER